MAKRRRVPRHRYLVWWAVVFVIAALSGASRVGEWHWRLLELTGARSTFLLLFLAAYLVPKRPTEVTRELIARTGRGIAYRRSAAAYLFRRTR